MSIEDLKLARKKLNANNVDAGLPGREEHGDYIYNFIYERIKIRHSGAAMKARVESGLVAKIASRHMNKTMFVCGVPGTGKTVTVEWVLKKMEKVRDKKNSPIHNFEHIYVNAQHLSSPEKVYTEILYKLTGEHRNSEAAQDKLNQIFLADDETCSVKSDENSKRRTKKPVTKKVSEGYKIVVIDELDLLYSDKRQTIFYSLFDWPTHAHSKMILIGIANAMDLSDRLIRSGDSRMGLEKRVFESYTSSNLQTILEVRLGLELLNKCFSKESVIVATRRIGKMTGDARRILDTSRLAIDKAIRLSETNKKFQQVTAKIIDEVGFQNFDLHRKNYIQTCRPIILLLLKAILKDTVRVGEENVEAINVFVQLRNDLKKNEFFKNQTISLNYFRSLLLELSAVGMIYLESNTRNLPHRRLFLIDDSEALRELIINENVKL